MKLYHVSYKNLGPQVTLYPRVPQNRAKDEDDKVKRVCVSPRIGDCLRLTAWEDGNHKLHVYATEQKQVPAPSWILPKKYVPDYRKWTREEVWLLNKKGYTFQYIGYIRMFRVEMMFGTAFWYFKKGGDNYGEWATDPTRIITESCWQRYIAGEVRRHLEMRKFILEVRVHTDAGKVHLARYADDVWAKQQIKEGKKPYRVPLYNHQKESTWVSTKTQR